MESKKNDLMLNIMENPSFSVTDFQNVGLNAGNTSLETENTYASSPIILKNPMFLTPTGEFDPVKFHLVYQGAQQAYNIMASEPNKDFTPTFSKYNIFAPMEQRNWNPEFKITKQANPDLITRGMIRIGEDGPRDRSREEIALTQKVYDMATGKWLDAPNDNFFQQLFGDNRVLAQYDNDVDINGIERGNSGFDENNIEHFAGEYKLNDNGTYYYETANGRSTYNKTVLHLSDIITTDGSAMNAIDFLDSDGIDKSPVGSLVKNTALIGAMFLPYVGPFVTGATILQQALGLTSTLGKIALGSDNKTMNFLEGLSKSTNFMETRSEYSKENTWSIENLLGMAGDVIGLLKQQRMLFKYLPAVVKGTEGASEAGQLRLQLKYLDELDKATMRSLSSGVKTSEDALRMFLLSQRTQMLNASKAATMLENYMKDYYDVGGTLSKAYMTLLTVNDIYGEAKEANASDMDAALITIGYAAAEYALLSTEIGSWILPELKAGRQKARGVAKALSKETLENFDKLKAAATTPAAKKNVIHKIIDYGKSLVKGDYAVGKKGTEVVTEGFGISKAGVKSVFSGALAEATEETSEELLGDVQRGLFNAIQYMKGSDVRLKPFENWQDRYVMSFIGGFLGGGVSASTIDYKQAKSYANMSYNQAIQELIYMDRNDELKDLYKILDKETIGNKYLSATKVVKDDAGNVIGWEQGDANDNLDLDIKNRIKSQLKLIHDTLNSAGGYASDDEILANNLDFLKDLRYSALRETTSAGRFLQEFNRLDSSYIEKALLLKALNSNQAKQEAGEKDQKDGESPELEEQRANLTKEMEDLKVQIEEMRSGKKAPLFMLDALIESTPFISKALMPSTYRYFVEDKEGKDWDLISESDKRKYIDEWNNYLKTDYKDDVHLAAHGYRSATLLFSGKLQELQKQAESIVQNQELVDFLNQTDAFLANFEKTVSDLERNPELTATTEEGDEIPITEDTLLEGLQEKENSNTIDFKDFNGKLNLLYKTLLSEIAKVSSQIEDLEQIHENGQTGDAEYSSQLESLLKKYYDLIDSYVNGIEDLMNSTIIDQSRKLAEGFIEQGHINAAVKDQFITKLKGINDLIKKVSNRVYLDILGDEDSILQAVPMYMVDPIIAKYSGNFYNDLKEEFESSDPDEKGLIKQLEELQYTPIMDILDDFSLNVMSLNGGLIKFSELLKLLQSTYQQSISDISQFNIANPEVLKAVRDGLQLIDLFEGVIEGARNDTVRLDTQFSAALGSGDRTNLWGINAIVNEVHRKAPKAEGDDWEDLPEISGKLSEMILQDVRLVKNKLKFFADLYAINSGQKLNKQVRVATNINYLLYNAIKKFTVDIVPDDWDKHRLEEALESATTLKELIDESPLGLSLENYTKVEKERIMLETAIYEFFNIDNKSKLNVQDLSKLLSADKFNLFTEKSTLLTEYSDLIDDHAFIAWMASKAAINSNDYHSDFKELLTDSERAPLASQEMGTYLQVANALNGNVISLFQEATKKSIVRYFDSLDFEKRKELLMKSGIPEAPAIAISTDAGKGFVNNLSFVPNYSNITFVEGIPGAGKSDAVDRFAISYIKRTNPGVLKNAWVAHIGEDDANKFGLKIGLVEGNFTALDRESLMKKISGNWADFKIVKGLYEIEDEDYELTSDGQIIPKWNIKKYDDESELPKLIVIDEISKFTHFDLLLLDRFAKRYGISIITTGDLDQSQARGKFKSPDSWLSKINEEIKEKGISLPDGKKQIDGDSLIFDFSIDRNQLIRSSKLGTTLRTANSLKTENQGLAQTVVQNMEGDLKLHYWEDETHLRGDKVFTPTSKGLNDRQISEIIKLVKEKIIPNLKNDEKIGYVFYSKESNLYKALMNDSSIKNHIEEYEGTSAQGKEGDFWIIEPDPNKNAKSYLLDLYTGITRAKEASIVVSKIDVSDKVKVSRFDTMDEISLIESLNIDSITKHCKKIKKVYDEAVENGKKVEYIERTKAEIIDTVGESTESEEKAESTESTEPTETPKPDQKAKEEEQKALEEEKERLEKISERENLVKDSEEFILPDDIKTSFVNGVATFSMPAPVSRKWIEKYFPKNDTIGFVETDAAIPLKNDIYYVTQAEPGPDGNIVVSFASDADGYLIGNVVSNQKTLGTLFNNAIDLLNIDPVDPTIEPKKAELIKNVTESEFTVPEGFKSELNLDAEGNTVVTFTNKEGAKSPIQLSGYWLLKFGNINNANEQNAEELLSLGQSDLIIDEIVINKDNPTNLLVKGHIGENVLELTIDILSYDVFNGIITKPEYVDNGSSGKTTDTDVLLVTGNESNSIQGVVDQLKKLGKRTNLGRQSEPSIATSSDFNLEMLLFSDSSFEFGTGKIHPVKDTYELGKYHEYRIDNINGLVKLAELLKKKGSEAKGIFELSSDSGTPKPIHDVNSYSDMYRILADLWVNAKSIKDKLKLEEYFSRLLGLSNIYCRFAIKKCVNNAGGIEKGKNDEFLKFYKGEDEEVWKATGSKRRRQVNMRNLVIIIGSNEVVDGEVVGDVLEMPMLTLNNPISILKASIEKAGDEDMKTYKAMYASYQEVIDNAKSEHKDGSEAQAKAIRRAQPEALQAAINTSYEHVGQGKYIQKPGTRNLVNLIKLYLCTDRSIFYQDDPNWTIGKNLFDFGPLLNINRGEFDEDYDPELKEGRPLVSLSEFAKNPTLKVSDIMVYTRSDGQYEVTLNGVTKIIKGFISQPGHPFVLYTDDPSVVNLEEQFIKQQIANKLNGKPITPKVKLAYVIGPKFTFEEYMNSVLSFVSSGGKGGTLGNIKTPLDMLYLLLYDKDGNPNPELQDLFVEIWGKRSGLAAYERVKQTVTELHNLGQEKGVRALAEKLKEVVPNGLLGGFDNYRMSSQLQNVLKQLVLNSAYDPFTGKTDILGKYNDKHMQIVSELFKKHDKQFFDTARLKTRSSDEYFARVKVQPGNKYKIDNGGRSKIQDFYLSGELSTSMYRDHKGTMRSWINKIVNGSTENGSDKKLWYKTTSNGGRKYMSSDTRLYLGGNSDFIGRFGGKKSKGNSEGSDEKTFSDSIMDMVEITSDILPEEEMLKLYQVLPDPTKPEDDSFKVKKIIVKTINDSPQNHIAFMLKVGDDLQFFTDKNDLFGQAKLILNGKEVQQINKNAANRYEFLIETKGKLYDATITVIDGNAKLSIVEKDTPKKRSSNSVKFTESTGGYAQRTKENADWSDVTLALADDFTTAGELKTAEVAGAEVDRKKKKIIPKGKYISSQLPIDTDEAVTGIAADGDTSKLHLTGPSGFNPTSNAELMLEEWEQRGLPKKNIKLNIAGNGIYTLGKTTTQEELNEYVTLFIKTLLDNGITISEIRSGGQTGIDEAGIIAAQRLGIPASVHAPKNWLFRDSSGKDRRSTKEEFMSRFDYSTLRTIEITNENIKTWKKLIGYISSDMPCIDNFKNQISAGKLQEALKTLAQFSNFIIPSISEIQIEKVESLDVLNLINLLKDENAVIADVNPNMELLTDESCLLQSENDVTKQSSDLRDDVDISNDMPF